MALHLYRLLSGAQTLTATTAKTILQLVTPATRLAMIRTLEIGFASVTATDAPVLIQLFIQTTAGTMSALTPVAIDQTIPASLCTGCQKTATAEPTTTTELWSQQVTPVGGTAVFVFPKDEQIKMAVSTKVGLVCTSPATQTANVRAVLTFEE